VRLMFAIGYSKWDNRPGRYFVLHENAITSEWAPLLFGFWILIRTHKR